MSNSSNNLQDDYTKYHDKYIALLESDIDKITQDIDSALNGGCDNLALHSLRCSLTLLNQKKESSIYAYSENILNFNNPVNIRRIELFIENYKQKYEN